MKDVKMIGEMKDTAVRLLRAKAIADIQLQSFFQGCKLGLGLEGNWNLDTRTLTFTKMSKVKEGDK